jgi:hypothetical protein
MRRLTVGLLVLAALLLQGCLCILVCPETFGDMRLQADDLDLPDDFTLVAEESGGSRSTFAAAHAPEVSREYAAPWEDGKLCDRIRSLAGSSSLWPAKEESFRREYGGCGFDTRIAAGWRAWPVNNWSYKLFVAVTPPDWRSRPSEEECIKVRAKHEEQQKSGRAGPYQRYPGWCWVPTGHALVDITVRAGQGWFTPAV